MRDDIADWIDIRRVQNRYADLVTRRAWDELDSVMVPDVRLDLDLADRTMSVAGVEAIGEFIATSLGQFSFFEFVVLNTVMDIDSERGVAGARMWMAELRQRVDTGRRTDAYGVYEDQLLRTDDGWRFTVRRYSSWSRTNETGEGDTDQLVFNPATTPLGQLIRPD